MLGLTSILRDVGPESQAPAEVKHPHTLGKIVQEVMEMLLLMKAREDKQIKTTSKAPKDEDDSEYGGEDFSSDDSDLDSDYGEEKEGENLFDVGEDKKEAEAGGDTAMDDDAGGTQKTGQEEAAFGAIGKGDSQPDEESKFAEEEQMIEDFESKVSADVLIS